MIINEAHMGERAPKKVPLTLLVLSYLLMYLARPGKGHLFIRPAHQVWPVLNFFIIPFFRAFFLINHVNINMINSINLPDYNIYEILQNQDPTW